MESFKFVIKRPDNENIRICFKEKKPMGQALHRKAMDYFRQYMIVGGMPQAVKTYVNTYDFDKVDRVKRDIIELYRADVVKHARGYEIGIVSEEIYKKLLFDKLEVNKGMIVENIVAQMLTAGGHKLYFYARASRDDVSSRMEIDFLIAKSKISSCHNISAIEVKSGKNYTLSSLKKFITKYREQLNIPYVLHTSDLMEKEGIVFLPLYMTPLL